MPPPNRKKLLQDFYSKYAPDQQLTDERLNLIDQKYGDDNETLIKDLYGKYAPDQEMSPERMEAISTKYELKKKATQLPHQIAAPNQFQFPGQLDFSKPLPENLSTTSESLSPEQRIDPSIEGTDLGIPIIKSPGDPMGIGQTIVKQIYSGFGDQVPKTLAQATEVGISSLQASNMDEYIKRSKSKEFQKYVRSIDPEFLGDGGFIDKAKGLLTPFDIDKHLPKYKGQFIKDSGLEDIEKSINEKQPGIINRRRGVEDYVQQQNKESAKTMAGIPQSYKDIKSPADAIRYATNLATQGLWQIPLVIATKGMSGLAMESAEVYDNQLDQIVQKHNEENPKDIIDRDEAIKRNLDKPAEGQAYAIAAAGLDTFSAGGLMDLVKKGGSSLVKKALAVTTETLTEPTQGMLEEMGGAKGAGQSEFQAFKDAWTKNLSKRIDESAGGFFGGGIVSLASPETNKNGTEQQTNTSVDNKTGQTPEGQTGEGPVVNVDVQEKPADQNIDKQYLPVEENKPVEESKEPDVDLERYNEQRNINPEEHGYTLLSKEERDKLEPWQKGKVIAGIDYRIDDFDIGETVINNTNGQALKIESVKKDKKGKPSEYVLKDIKDGTEYFEKVRTGRGIYQDFPALTDEQKDPIGYYSNEPVPQDVRKLKLIASPPTDSYFRAGIENNPRVAVKLLGYKAETQDEIIYGQLPDGKIGEFKPMETFSDLKPEEIESQWGIKSVVEKPIKIDKVKKSKKSKSITANTTGEESLKAMPESKIPEGQVQEGVASTNSAEDTSPKPKRNGFANSLRKYSAMDAVTPRLAILKYFALGGRLKHDQAVGRTGYGSKDLYGWTSKKGKSYDDLVQLAREESGRNDFDEGDFLNEIDDIIKGSKKSVFDELKDYLSQEDRQELQDTFDSYDPDGVQSDSRYNALTDEEKLQLYEEQEEAFRGGIEQDVEQSSTSDEEQNNDGERPESGGEIDSGGKEIIAAQEELDNRKSELESIQREYNSLQSKLEANLTENQTDLFGQNKTQSLFDDRSDQQKVVDAKKKELESAREAVKKSEENLQRKKDSVGQISIDNSGGRITQAQLVDRADGRTQRQIETASKRIGSASLKKLIGKLKQSFPNFNVVHSKKGFLDAYQKFKDLGIIKQIIGEEGAKTMDVDDILIGKDEAARRMDNLMIAKEMESNGKSPKEIYMATGWEKGTEGKWRMEIKYGDFQSPNRILNEMLVIPFGKRKIIGKLEDIYNAPSLFKAYPQLRNVKIELVHENSNNQAEYDRAEKTIRIYVTRFRRETDGRSREEIQSKTANLRGLRRIFTHEIQHAVQYAEGFAPGGNPGMFDVQLLKKYIKTLSKEEQETITEQQLREKAYRALVGETESRNAAERTKLTEDERAFLSISETEDIDRNDQIILKIAFKDQAQLQQPQGQQLPSGFVFKDTVYINPDLVRADTPIHEFGHLWTVVAKNKMQPIYRMGINLVKGSPYHKSVLKNKSYADLTPEQQLDEALAMAIGERGALIVDKQSSNRFTEWFKDLFDRIKRMLGIKHTLDFANMSLDDYLNVVAKELLTPGEISTLSNLKMPETATFRLKNYKLPQDAYKEIVARQVVDMAIANDPNSWRMSAEGLWRRTFNTMLEGFQDRTRRLKEIQNDIIKFYLDKTVKSIKESNLSNEEKKARLEAIQNKRTALEAALIPASEDPHGLYDLMTGKIQYKTEKMHSLFFGKPTGERGYGTVLEHLTKETDIKNLKTKEDTESIAYQLKKEGLSLYDLGFYAYVLHAKERNAKINEKREKEGLLPIAGSGMTDQQADNFMKEIEQSGKKDVLEKYRQIMQRELVDKPLQMKLDAGLLNQETYDILKNHFQNYTPIVVEELAVGKGEKPVGKLSNGVWGSGIKRLVGTDEYDYTKRVNPFVQLMFNYEKTIAEIERNKTLTGMAKLVKRYPDAKVWSLKSPKYKIEVDENGDVQYVSQFKDKDIDSKGVPFMVDGKRRFIIIEDSRLRDLFTKPGRTPSEFEKVVSDLIKNSFSYLRLAFTGLNPSFAFPNFVRDAQDAVVNLSDSEVKGIRSKVFNPKNIGSAMKAIWQYEKDGDMSSDYAKAYEEMKSNGGQIAWLNYANAEKFYTDTKTEIDKVFKGDASGKAKTLALLPFRATLRYTLLANKVMEMAIRLSTYKALRDAGVSADTSALSSKNVTVNFNKQGSYNPILSSLYLFLNAGIQGSARMITSLSRSRQARRLVAGSMAGFVLMRILNQAIDDAEDDEEKKTLRKLTRQDYKENLIINWLQPMGMDKSVIKIPMSYNMRGFKAISDGIYDVAAGNATAAEAMADIVSIYFNSLVPISETGAVPTLAQPYVELRDNKRMFNDTPIMPESSFGFKKKDSERYFGTPSALATGMANALADVNEGRDDIFEVSPNQIDYVFDWTTGGLKNWYKTGETAVNAAKGVNQFDWNKVAVIQRFYADLEKQDWRDQVLFYDLYNKGIKRRITENEFDKLKSFGAAADKKELLKPGVFQRNLQEVIRVQRETYDQKLK